MRVPTRRQLAIARCRLVIARGACPLQLGLGLGSLGMRARPIARQPIVAGVKLRLRL